MGVRGDGAVRRWMAREGWSRYHVWLVQAREPGARYGSTVECVTASFAGVEAARAMARGCATVRIYRETRWVSGRTLVDEFTLDEPKSGSDAST